MSKLGQKILDGLKEAQDWVRGNRKLLVRLPDGTKQHMSQDEYDAIVRKLEDDARLARETRI